MTDLELRSRRHNGKTFDDSGGDLQRAYQAGWSVGENLEVVVDEEGIDLGGEWDVQWAGILGRHLELGGR